MNISYQNNPPLDGVTLTVSESSTISGIILDPRGERYDTFAKSRDGTAGHLVFSGGDKPFILGSLPSGDIGVLVSWFGNEAKCHFDSKRSCISLVGAQQTTPIHGVVDTFTLETASALRASLSWNLSLGAMRKVRALFEAGVPDFKTSPIPVDDRELLVEQPIPGGTRCFFSLKLTDGHLCRVGDEIIFTPEGGKLSGAITLTTDHHRHPTYALEGIYTEADAVPIDDVLSYYLAWRKNAIGFPTALVAGSPRFNNLFPRDFSHWLLAQSHRLTTEFKVDALRALLFRVAGAETAPYQIGTNFVRDGELSHEDTVGEAAGNASGFALDYMMIDTTYLLLPVVRSFLETGSPFDDALISLLSENDAHGVSTREKLFRNIRRVADDTAAFAESRNAKDLIAFKPDAFVGAWRDSETGDFGTRRPMYVSMALAPAALEAGAFLLDALKKNSVELNDAPSAESLRSLADVWRTATPQLFTTSIPNSDACAAITRYCSLLGIPHQDACSSLEGNDLRFLTVGLHDDGSSVRVQSTDVAFVLSYTDPDPEIVRDAALQVIRPFPAGLRIPNVGFAVAAPLDDLLMVSGLPHHYHGSSVWSFHNYQMLFGLNRQLGRSDLPPNVRSVVESARDAARIVIKQVAGFRHHEFWGWRYDQTLGRFSPEPVDNPRNDPCRIQLWSTFGSAVRD